MSFGMKATKPEQSPLGSPLLNARRAQSLRVEYRAVNPVRYSQTVEVGPWRATKATAIKDLISGGGLQARVVSMPEHLPYSHSTKEFGDLK